MLEYFNVGLENKLLNSYFHLFILFIISFLLFFAGKIIYKFLARTLANRLHTIWGEALFNENFLFQLSCIAPFIFILKWIPEIGDLPRLLTLSIKKISLLLVIYFFIRAISVFLIAVGQAYEKRIISKVKPIKSFIQIAQILLWGAGIIIFLSALLDKSPAIFLSGLGALAAVLLLVFRDTLLSLVAGIQITGNNLIKIGDWIEMPGFNADGDVIDIALNSVQVQNWDKTITVIPTHKFLENSFKNWKGMTEIGGRRIKRSIFIDMNSVKFLTAEEIKSLKNFDLLKDYIEEKEKELNEHNKKYEGDSSRYNSRRLTNIGTFRAYVFRYLKNNPKINQKLSLIVRQLDSTPFGLPIEIYAFSNDVAWANYENIQGDIFDHLFAILPEFKLSVFQSLGGKDLYPAKSN